MIRDKIFGNPLYIASDVSSEEIRINTPYMVYIELRIVASWKSHGRVMKHDESLLGSVLLGGWIFLHVLK
jgi:hypothetical protein